MPSVAETIASLLHSAGIRYVFGLPGGETVELLDALRRQGLEFVLAHSESAAVLMADGYARLTGTVGVCLTTLGPGATNAVVGVAHAYLDRSPILIFTAQKPDALLPDYTHQVLDLHALFRPITKATLKLAPPQAAATVAEALALAVSDRPGPVHLQLSNEDAGQPAADSGLLVMRSPGPPAPDTDSLVRARALLAQARRPLIVAGLGLEPQRPYEALRELAEALQAPVVVTPKAKGALPDHHPLAAGTVGLTRTDPVYAILAEADCIVAVGFDLVELVLPWQTRAALIWLAPWANRDPVLPADVELVGDIAHNLFQLADGPTAASPDWGADRVARFRAAQTEPDVTASPGRLLPQEVLSELRAALPADSALAVDVGSHKIFGSLSWFAETPNRFLVSNGLSSMGFALPAAIGAALATPGRPVACLTGDAGLAMVLGELGVLTRLQLPVVVVVLNDGAIDLIRSHQVRAGKPIFGTEFPTPDFAQIAAAYGLWSQRITDRKTFADALAYAITLGQPAVLEVMLDPSSYPTTPRANQAV